MMKTPQIAINPGDYFRLGFHDRRGASRHVQAVGDGKVEKEITDELNAAGLKECFISALDDPRLNIKDPFSELAKSGWQQNYDEKVYGGFSMSCSAADGVGQKIVVQGNPKEDGVVNLTSSAGDIEHSLVRIYHKGVVDYDQETLVLNASAAGVPVYKDGAILFDMPSAYTGGCTV